MAEKTILVCDVCGAPAVDSVTIRVARRTLNKDLCELHLQEVTAGARPVRRGRPRAIGRVAVKRGPSRTTTSPSPSRKRKPRSNKRAATAA